jgi:hypothetical protein
MPIEEFTKYYFRQSITKYAKGLGEWGAVVRRLMKDNPEGQKALDDISRAASDLDAMGSAQNWWRRVDNIRRGLLVDHVRGGGMGNTLAGEFSVNLELGFLIEDGRLAGRVKNCMLFGNMYELLKDGVEAIGDTAEMRDSLSLPHFWFKGISAGR